MALIDLGPPQVNLYGMISGIGNSFDKSYAGARKAKQEDALAEATKAAPGLYKELNDSFNGTGNSNSLMGSLTKPVGTPDASTAPVSGAVPPDQIKAIIDNNVPAPLRQYAYQIASKESSFNPDATSPTGAKGLFQFTKGTGKDYGLVTDEGDQRHNPEANTAAFVNLTQDNFHKLRDGLGRDPTLSELALAHQQGASGALALLSGKNVDPNNLAVNNAGGLSPQAAAQKITGYYGLGNAPTPTNAFSGSPAAAPVQVAAAQPGTMTDAGPATTGAIPPTAAGPAIEVPGYPGQKFTRAQSNDAEGVPSQAEWDAAAKGASAAPAVAAAPQPAAQPQVAQAAPAAAPQTFQAPQQAPVGPNNAVLMKMLANPITAPFAQKVIQDRIARDSTPQPAQLTTGTDGNQYIFDPRTRTLTPTGISKPDENVKTLITPQERAQYGVPADYTGAVQVDSKGKLSFPGKPATEVNVNQSSEKAEAQEVGKAKGKLLSTAIEAGPTNQQKLQTLAQLNDALKAGGGNITTGPFADAVLAGKQAIGSALGIDLAGTGPSEVAKKLGFSLATQLTKEITNRPAQAEFLRALENVPGLSISPEGNRALISLQMQDAQHKIALSDLAASASDYKSYRPLEQAFYQAHPLISPFTGKPFGQQDIDLLTKAGEFAQRNQKAQPTGKAPTTPSVGAVMQGYRFKGGDPSQQSSWEAVQ